MGIRFKKRLRILRIFYLNIGKDNISISIGIRNITYNMKTKRFTFSLPNTGLSYQTSSVKDDSINK